MPVTDTIADMLTIVRNGFMAHKEAVMVKRSNVNENILSIMKREGFIANYKPAEDSKQGIIKVYLKYDNENKPALTGIKRVSTPGLRIYRNNKNVKGVYGGIGITVVSTSQGIMTDKEANEKKLGGEIVCEIW